jgi:transcriptional regulator with XRE-family HTH domain
VANDALRRARLAAGLSQWQLAAAVNTATGRETLEGSTISRYERGTVARPRQRVIAALCAVLRCDEAGLGFAGRVTPEPVTWALRHDTCTPEALTAVADVLAATRRLKDAVGAAVVLPAIDHHVRVAVAMARTSKLRHRYGALALLGELQTYRGYLRHATGDHAGARLDFTSSRSAAIEGDSAKGTAAALSFEACVDRDEGDYVAAISRTQASVRYEPEPVTRQHYHLLLGRWLAQSGDVAGAERELIEADRVTVIDPELTSHNYFFLDGWMIVQRGLVHAGAGRARAAVAALDEGLRLMPVEHASAPWARWYGEERDRLS